MIIRIFLPLFLCLFLYSCAHKTKDSDEPILLSIQLIDRNGFSETISSKDRLNRYENTDFLEPQSYQKVLRVFGKNKEGKTPSVITSYHPNGQLWQYLEIANGRANGLYREWHYNGTKKMELHVIEGIPELSEVALKSWVFDGTNYIWNDKGGLIAEISYEKGVLQGDSIYYYPDGKIQKRIPYFQDQVDGVLACYHENSEIAEMIPHIKGVRHGKASSFFSDQSCAYEETFENGLLLEGRYYSKDGSLLSSIDSGFGKRCEWTNGLLKRIVEYKKGTPEGLIQCFDETGNLKTAFYEKDGKKHGEEWEYYTQDAPQDNHQPKLLLHWQEDILQGIVKTWFPDGTQESQKEMYQNKKNGTAYAWYKNGDLMLFEEYEKDFLISGTYYKKGDKKPVSKIINGKGVATLYHPDGYLLQKIIYEKGAPSLENVPDKR